MDVKIINPFLSAGLATFEQMFSIKPENKEPLVLEVNAGHPWEVSGLLGVTGDYNGVVAFRLHKTLAYKLLDLSGISVRPEEKNEMAQQLVSEFTNIVAGSAVSSISDMNLCISPPVTISGPDHTIAWPRSYPVVGIPFVTPFGPYEVDVCFK